MAEQQILVWLLFEQEGAALLMRRKPVHGVLSGWWTLPGERMRETESASELVAHVAAEDLGVRVTSEDFVDTFFLTEGDFEYAVNVFRPVFEGRLRFRESGPYEEARWVTPAMAQTLEGVPQALVELLGGKRHWQDQAS